jgi:hypothetical protein
MNERFSFWRGFVGMAVAFLLGLLIWHAYIDHQNLHAIINLINANAAKANGAASHTP